MKNDLINIKLNLTDLLKRFSRDESGATVIEYSLICLFMFLVIVASVKSVGTKTSSMYNNIKENIGGNL